MRIYVNILGTVYSIEIIGYKDDKAFEKREIVGYCDSTEHKLVVCDLKDHPSFEDETDEYRFKQLKHTIRHETIHAYLSESGLEDNALTYEGPWSRNESMVDYFAIQGPKIFETWNEISLELDELFNKQKAEGNNG